MANKDNLPIDGNFLSVKEVAEILFKSERTIRDYLNDGKLRGTKIHKTGNWLIPKSEIDRFYGGSLSDTSQNEVEDMDTYYRLVPISIEAKFFKEAA